MGNWSSTSRDGSWSKTWVSWGSINTRSTRKVLIWRESESTSNSQSVLHEWRINKVSQSESSASSVGSIITTQLSSSWKTNLIVSIIKTNEFEVSERISSGSSSLRVSSVGK